MIDTALIYAAGRGTRMGMLTDNTPKPLLKMNNRALIDYGVDLLMEARVPNLHVNAAYLCDQIKAHFHDKNAQIHLEPNGALETGGTLKNLAPILPSRILTMNSDVLFFDQNPVRQLIENDHPELDAILVLIPKEQAIGNDGQGDFFWNGKELQRRGDFPYAPFVFSGLQIINPARAIEFSPQVFSTNLIWDELMIERKIGAVVYDGAWMDVGNIAAFERAQDLLVRR